MACEDSGPRRAAGDRNLRVSHRTAAAQAVAVLTGAVAGLGDRSEPGEIIRPSVWRSSVYAATSTGPPVWVKPGYQRRKGAEGSLLRRTWGSDKVPIETVRGSVLDADGRSPGARADDLPRIRTVFPSSREFRRSEGLSAGTQGSVGVRTEMDPWVRGRTAGAHPTVQSSTIRPRRRGAPAVGHPLGKSGLDERGR